LETLKNYYFWSKKKEMKSPVFVLIVLIGIFISCNKENSSDPNPTEYVVGKNRFTINIDGDAREYFVHVPKGYTGSAQTPVVFMLHGTNGNGEDFYTNSGWKEVGETENIITVFPSSWKYCIVEGAQQHPNTEKWNAQPANWGPCAGERLRDDIKFLNAILTELNSKFNVNTKRVYLVGFSNGGSMASKCTYEMSDKFAAIVESASSLFGLQSNPLRKLPILLQRGNEDYGPGGSGPTAPMSSLSFMLTDSATNLLQGHLYKFSHTNIYHFGLNPKFTISGDTNSIVTATYTSKTPNEPLNIYTVALIKGLKHSYPLGAAAQNWKWLKQYSLP
jgi:poly(3-hydroxybutyrate) depolymerase